MKYLSRVIQGMFLLVFTSTVQAGLISQGDFSIDMQEKVFTALTGSAVTSGIELDSTILTPTGSNAFFTGAISIDVSDITQTIELFVTETFSDGIADFCDIYSRLNNLVLPGEITDVAVVSDTLLRNPGQVTRTFSFTGNSISLDYDPDDPREDIVYIQSGGRLVLSYKATDVPLPGTLSFLIKTGIASRKNS